MKLRNRIAKLETYKPAINFPTFAESQMDSAAYRKWHIANNPEHDIDELLSGIRMLEDFYQ